MMQWGRRMIDKPAWFRMYARLRQKQEEYERRGVPSRLRGKMRWFAPYLPDWAGNMGFFDPLSKLFPFEDIFNGPLEYQQMNQSRQRQVTFETLRTQLASGEITDEEYGAAVEEQSGYVWEAAWEEAGAQTEAESGGAAGMVEMMMGKALYIDVPEKLLSGRENELSVMPITRTGQALEQMFDGEGIGKLGTWLASPERKLREKHGLSEFGEYGDYYVDRQLANLAAENPLQTKAVQEAMISREGPLYEEAYERVAQEVSMRVPGVLQAEAIKNAEGPEDALNVLGSMFAGVAEQVKVNASVIATKPSLGP